MGVGFPSSTQPTRRAIALLNIIGIPFFQGTQGGNADAQRNAIAISDIQVKVAEL
jgi:hypothetical protein